MELHGPSGRGQYALVDDEDYDELMKYKWYLRSDGYTVRVEGNRKTGNRTIRMHRVINKNPEHLYTDHINGIRRDNRKQNLRTVTKHQNNMNTSKKRHSTSGYVGVSWSPKTSKWRSRLCVDRQEIWLGDFSTTEEAAYVFDQAALQFRGDFARLNLL